MTWNLYKEGTFLEPLCFSNKKTQEDITSEILGKIREGKKMIFVHGACGSGKSAIALNIAKEIGKTSIVVPGKNLQMQYKKDYEKDKYVLKKNGEKLKINVITGRNNHKCKFLLDNKTAVPVIKKEVNSKLHDIFSGVKRNVENEINNDESADNKNIPCKIEIKEKNWERIKRYLIRNKLIDSSKLTQIKDVRRASVASVCPYWSPVLKSDYEFRGPIFKDAKKREYKGLNGKHFTIYTRKEGCPFYAQFNSFLDSDVIVFNSQKYKLETIMDRKPETEVEIIDECDEFLDSFSNREKINIDRFQNALIAEITKKEDFDENIREIFEIIKHLKENERVKNSGDEEIIPLRETGLYDLLKIILDNEGIFSEIDDESYIFHVEEVARIFEDLVDETYISVDKKDGNLVFSLVAVNLAKKLKEMIGKNKCFVFMSGTLHSDQILKNVFGIEDFCHIEAETKNQGEIIIKKTGLEEDCRYSNFSNGKFSREDYLKSLDKCVEVAKKPTLVHVNAFMDLPTEIEIERYNLKNLISHEKVRENQIADKGGREVSDFKKGLKKILFSTRVSRGADFPGEECNSIIFTKFPNPNIKDPFWRILNKTKPEHYWELYRDKARRELLQKIYRGLRFGTDRVEVLSPDKRVLEFFEKILDVKKASTGICTPDLFITSEMLYH